MRHPQLRTLCIQLGEALSDRQDGRAPEPDEEEESPTIRKGTTDAIMRKLRQESTCLEVNKHLRRDTPPIVEQTR